VFVVEEYAVPIPVLASRASSGAMVVVRTHLADGASCRALRANVLGVMVSKGGDARGQLSSLVYAHVVEPQDRDPLIWILMYTNRVDAKHGIGQALKEEQKEAKLSSQHSNFARAALRVPASDVHDIVCGAKRSLHFLLQEISPYLHTYLLNGPEVINQTFKSGNKD